MEPLALNTTRKQFRTSPIALSTTWTPVTDIIRTFQAGDRLAVHGIPTGTLTDIQITAAMVNGGAQLPLIVDAAFASSPFVLYASSGFQTASTDFVFVLQNLLALAEIQIWAKGSGSLTLEGGLSISGWASDSD